MIFSAFNKKKRTTFSSKKVGLDNFRKFNWNVFSSLKVPHPDRQSRKDEARERKQRVKRRKKVEKKERKPISIFFHVGVVRKYAFRIWVYFMDWALILSFGRLFYSSKHLK